jgi:hypothetical protein
MATNGYIKKLIVTYRPVTSKDALQVAGSLPQKFSGLTAATRSSPPGLPHI